MGVIARRCEAESCTHYACFGFDCIAGKRPKISTQSESKVIYFTPLRKPMRLKHDRQRRDNATRSAVLT